MEFPQVKWVDLVLCPLLLTLGIYLLYFFKKRYEIKSPYFVPLFYAKLLGLAVFLLVSIAYSNVGDTFKYYEGSKLLFRVFLRSPWVYFKVIFSDNTYVHELLLNLYPNNAFKGDFSFLSMVKIVSFFNTICFNSFWSASLLFSYLSYIGSWMMYVGLKKISCLNAFQSIVILFFPSVLFWVSGIMKDSFCYFLLGVLFYLWINFYGNEKVKKKGLKIFGILISMYLLFLIKWYILFAFLGSYFLVLLILLIRRKLNSKQNILLILLSVLIIGFVGNEIFSDRSLVDQIVLRIKDFHNWHFLISNSKYSFDEMNYNVITLIKYFPKAVSTALFRPFFWEVNSLFLLLTVVESAFLLVLLLLAIVTLKMSGLKKALKKPNVLWVIFFVLLLSYVVGLSSYSFGAMSRYRIPILPFYLFFVTMLFRLNKQRS